MLHMILAILKLIGVLLAAVFLLVLLLVVLILFAPLRYELRGRRFQDTQGSVKVGWLFGLLGFRASYQEKRLWAGVRLLGLSKQIFPEEEKQISEKREKKKKAAKSTEMSRKQEPSAEPPKSEEPAKSKELLSSHPPEASCEGTKKKEEEESESQWILVKILKKIQTAARKLWQRIQKIPKKIQKIGQSIQKAKKRLRGWIHLLTSDLVKGLIRRYKGYLLYLIRHMRPRKAEGSLRFGLGDPALTGQLTGVLYLLLPASCQKLELYPEFGACVLEGEAVLRGHIRLCHLAFIGWKVFRDKELRRLIKKVKA